MIINGVSGDEGAIGMVVVDVEGRGPTSVGILVSDVVGTSTTSFVAGTGVSACSGENIFGSVVNELRSTGGQLVGSYITDLVMDSA
jgi:hypothetical protein